MSAVGGGSAVGVRQSWARPKSLLWAQFQIGAATVAAEKGLEDSVIKILGRWDRLAYLEYICIPRASLTHYSMVSIS